MPLVDLVSQIYYYLVLPIYVATLVSLIAKLPRIEMNLSFLLPVSG